MNRTRTFDDEGTRQLVEKGDIKGAMEAVHTGLATSICGWLRKRLPKLSYQELAGIWSDTICAVIDAIQQGRCDTTAPLFPWVCRIAYNRASEYLRRATVRSRSRAEVTDILLHFPSYQGWCHLTEPERREVIHVVCAAIQTLPPKQRVVIQAYVSHFPESRDIHNLQHQVSVIMDEPQTLASIKRALQEGRRKVRAYLLSRGYGPEEGDLLHDS